MEPSAGADGVGAGACGVAGAAEHRPVPVVFHGESDGLRPLSVPGGIQFCPSGGHGGRLRVFGHGQRGAPCRRGAGGGDAGAERVGAGAQVEAGGRFGPTMR